MTNLQNYSLEALLNLDAGITGLFFWTSTIPNIPLDKKAWEQLNQVLITQQEAQKEIHSRILEKYGQIDFERSIIEGGE